MIYSVRLIDMKQLNIEKTMRSCRHILATAMTFIMVLTAMTASADTTWRVPDETLTYDVMYKWGMINKKAGSVSITTSAIPSGDRFKARLTGATAPWADKFYLVRDTLRGTIDAATFVPYQYEKVAYEGGDFNHDELWFTRSGNTTRATVIHRRKRKKDTEASVTRKEMQASGTTLDMLSSFYYMRHLDYTSMHPGHTVRLNVFSGTQQEILTIHYEGVENVKIGKKSLPSYHITFTFTSGSGKKTSDNMDAWLSTDGRKIPLLLEGKLPVGKIRCLYSGSLAGL